MEIIESRVFHARLGGMLFGTIVRHGNEVSLALIDLVTTSGICLELKPEHGMAAWLAQSFIKMEDAQTTLGTQHLAALFIKHDRYMDIIISQHFSGESKIRIIDFFEADEAFLREIGTWIEQKIQQFQTEQA